MVIRLDEVGHRSRHEHAFRRPVSRFDRNFARELRIDLSHRILKEAALGPKVRQAVSLLIFIGHEIGRASCRERVYREV